MGLRRVRKKKDAALTAVRLSLKRQGWRPSAFSAARSFWQIYQKSGYEPVEAFRLGFFDPQFDRSQMGCFLSRKQTTRLQEALNPPILSGLFKNKVVFYQQCHIHRLPCPRIHGVFSFLGKTFHACHNGDLVILNDRKLLADVLPRQFAIKPVEGSLGDGFKIVTQTTGGFQDHNGTFYTASDFMRLLTTSSPVGMLLQEVVENHPDITFFSGVSALQTVRIMNLVNSDGCIEILSAFFKTITQKNIVTDTHIDHLKGNLEVLIDPADGSLGRACYLDGDGKGIIAVPNHPVSGIPFEGFVIPYWAQARELAKEAARTALPVRTIGWDIALTPQGPCLIEGNIWWNPSNQHLNMGHIAERMKCTIQKLSH